MKKILVVPAVILSLVGIGNSEAFAATDVETPKLQSVEFEKKLALKEPIIQEALVADQNGSFNGQGRQYFVYRGNAGLRTFILNTGGSTFTYEIRNSKGGYLISGTLKPGQQAISEFKPEWGDWLPEGKYSVYLETKDGSTGSFKLAGRTLE